MPYTKQYTIRMRDTDAAGLIYFAEQLRIAHETFEAYLDDKGLSFSYLLKTSPYMVPIVHAESDYRAPLFVGDKLDVQLCVDHIGTSSFTMRFDLTKEDGTTVGQAKITHVAIDRTTRKKIPVPEEIKEHLVHAG